MGARYDGGASCFNGHWSEFALFNRALTVAERRHVLGAMS